MNGCKMLKYGYQKEARGYSVWTLCPHTEDRRDWVADCRSASQAQAMINRLTKPAHGHGLQII